GRLGRAVPPDGNKMAGSVRRQKGGSRMGEVGHQQNGPAIREATEADWPAIWEMFRRVAVAGGALPHAGGTPEEVARRLWFLPPARAFVAEVGGRVVGTYYVRPNQPGRGAHVANAGYMVADEARGQGLASVLCAHSLETARQLGFLAMQFNFVVS